jgi:hypothetical protein
MKNEPVPQITLFDAGAATREPSSLSPRSLSFAGRAAADDAFRHRGSSTLHCLLRQVTSETIEGFTSGALVCGVIRCPQGVRNHMGTARGLGSTRLLTKKRGLVPARFCDMRRETLGGRCGHSGGLGDDDARSVRSRVDYPQSA